MWDDDKFERQSRCMFWIAVLGSVAFWAVVAYAILTLVGKVPDPAAARAASPPPAAAAERRVYTARATCYQLRGKTASGTRVNKRTAAHNFLAPGTRFRLVGKQAGPTGVRRYIVRDTGPALSDGHFDLWAPSGCNYFGVRTIRYVLGWSSP